MIPCPIAHWKLQQPDSLAFDAITYRELDALVQKLCAALSPISEPIIAFVPQKTALDLALFFAIWRLEKAAYPLSSRLPEKAIQERVKNTQAKYIAPQKLALTTSLNLTTLSSNQIATLIETSSATKIACHFLESHFVAAQSAIEALHLTKNDRYCLNLPLFHVSGIALCLRALIAGACIVSPQFWQQATHISMVSTQLFHLIQNASPTPHLKCLLIGGGPLSQTLEEKARHLPLYLSYGMTETASMAAVRSPKHPTAFLPHMQFKISSDKEILLKGPSLLDHYWGKKQQTGWFATNDLGEFNENQEFKILGRKDRQFISGGENILPEEIEKELLQLPQVIEARVEPKSDPEFGMRPIAKLFCDSELSADAIKGQLEEKLPRYKVPQEISISTKPLANSKLVQLIENG